ncbi:hypothetical protein TI05_03245 [Achromatium sp. WMS3]|nr:hypothetical protein TI05_03245 [Achromatium sp. WMS3]
MKDAKKRRGDLAEIRETGLYNILKDREIFLKDLAENSPRLNGKEVHVILADVCFDVAHYYSGKGDKESHKQLTR